VPSIDDERATTPREVRRQVRMDAKRSRTLDAAERSFATSGYHSTSVKSIADQCDIAIGTIYTLFGDKEGLFKAVLRRRGDVLGDLMTAKAGENSPGDGLLVTIAELQIQFFREHPDWAHIATSLISPNSNLTLPGVGAAGLYELGTQLAIDLQAVVIARGQHEGRIRTGNPQALARIFASMVATFHVLDEGSSPPGNNCSLDEFLDVVQAAFSTANPVNSGR
jgi:AcrR family transcriptional regulator